MLLSRYHDLFFSWSRYNKSCFLVITTYFSRDLDITKVAFLLSRLIFLVISILQKLFSRYHDLFFSWSRYNKSCSLVITTYFSRDLDITKVALSLLRLIFLVMSILQKLLSCYHDLFFSWCRYNKRCFLVISTYFSRDVDITKVALSLLQLIFLVISI